MRRLKLYLFTLLLCTSSVRAEEEYLYYNCFKQTETPELASEYGLEITPHHSIQLQDPDDFFTGGVIDTSTARNAYVKFRGFFTISTVYVEGNYALLESKLLIPGTKSGYLDLIV